MRTEKEQAGRRSRTADAGDGLFSVGSRVVYPSHGVAKITRRERRVFQGERCWYLVLEVPQRGWGTAGGMVLAVPEASAAELGVRAAISPEEAEDVLGLLGVINAHVPANWSRRFKNHQEKLKSGDVYQCAEVVRNLAIRLRTARLSAGERAMYTKARMILTSELAVSWGTGEEETNERVDDALGLPASLR